ncbi:MAG: hypothetical protein WC538_22195 [Thermoanaerobaculia bacterium]|jgi:hypothetical protein
MPSNFQHGVSSYGIPIFGNGGLITQGNVIFVKPSTGNDGRDGSSMTDAVKTLTRALALATANQNDVVVLIPEHGSTAASTTDYQSAQLDWNKNMVHLVGGGAPFRWSHRARIAQLSTATGVTSLVKVSASGCWFNNLSIFHGVADATSLVALEVTGSRNIFSRSHLAGIGNATMSAAGSASVKINGGSENVFDDCVIGLDTITRDADATEILMDGAASRNEFRDCLISSYISAAGFAGVTIADAQGIDRTLEFTRCRFFAKSTNKAVAQTSVFSIPAISQGAIILTDSYAASDGGAVDWDSNNRGIIWNNSVAAAASAAGGIFTNQ